MQESTLLPDIIRKQRTELGLSQQQMAERLDIKQQTYGTYETGRSKPNADFFEKWKEVFKQDLHNLIRRKGKGKGKSVVIAEEVETEVDTWPGVPMYDIPVYGGLPALIRDEKAYEPAYYLNIPSFRDCVFGTRISGDSMAPKIEQGDFVVCKEVENFIFGEIYLIITSDGQETVKYVHPGENKDWVNLVPHNPAVPVTPIHLKDIQKKYKVKGVMKTY